MSDSISTADLARLREQVLLAHARIAELEDTCAILRKRIQEERLMTEAAQRVADDLLKRQPLGPDVNSGGLNATSAQFEKAVADFKRIESRLLELDRERRVMQRSRSWRWTAPIRSIERWFARQEAE